MAVFALLLAGVAAGCGSQQQPSAADQAPGLSVQLKRVDAALAQHKFAEARKDLRALMADANAARRSGDLSAASAQRVLAAATEVLDALPSAAPSTSPTATGGSSPTSASSASPSPTQKPSHSPKPTRSPTSAPTSAPGTTAPAPTPSTAPTTQQPSPASSTQPATQKTAPAGSPTATPTA